MIFSCIRKRNVHEDVQAIQRHRVLKLALSRAKKLGAELTYNWYIGVISDSMANGIEQETAAKFLDNTSKLLLGCISGGRTKENINFE
jgi:hypothetical protein